MEPLNRFRNFPAATTQSRSGHEQPTVVLQPLLSPTSLQRSVIPPMASAAVPPPSSHLPSLHSATKLVSCEEEYLGVEGDSQVLNQGDLRLNGMKSVDEEFCNEIEWVPNSHSSSLDHKSDDHQKMNKNDYFNWRGSFLDEVDESKSSLLDDDYENKATFDDDELTKTEHRSVKRCVGSDDEDEVDGVDVLSQHQKLIQQMTVELKSCDIRCLPTICKDSVTPKMIEDLRPRKLNHMIRNKDLKETKGAYIWRWCM
ncbi:hypothetical protein SASPL_148044 [Salvia splendens]|uniref:Uncharacterized protein n=1 Tax=Salvia splendens TaxID=180675 RepID=A0A8X8Z303_SALSN|nr:hypothetical protein SASPL_148044 [Salvia splendens]